jgi:hypothetical protein
MITKPGAREPGGRALLPIFTKRVAADSGAFLTRFYLRFTAIYRRPPENEAFRDTVKEPQ